MDLSVWYLMGAILVFFMQCGFAMVETVDGEVDVTKSRKEKHNPDGTGGAVKKYCGSTRFLL